MKVAPLAKPLASAEDDDLEYLIQRLASEHEVLREYLGQIQFSNLVKNLIAAKPSHTRNWRLLSLHLADYLSDCPSLKRNPEVQELVALAAAMNKAFDAPKFQVVAMAQFVAMNKSMISTMPLFVHPSASLLIFKHNTTSIWSALKCQTQPPRPHALDHDQHILVWQQGESSRFRLLGLEEASAFEACRKTGNFDAICGSLTPLDSAEPAETRAADYLRGWVAAELIVAGPDLPTMPEKYSKSISLN